MDTFGSRIVLSGKMEITMSPNRPCFSPADSDDLFDSLTGELIYSPKKIYFR